MARFALPALRTGSSAAKTRDLSCAQSPRISLPLNPGYGCSRFDLYLYTDATAQQHSMTNQNQHWLPRLLLKKFADTDGRVFRFDIQTNAITKPPPRKAASSPGFNNFEIDGQLVSFEKRLEKIETKAAPALQRIVEARSLTGLQPKDRKNIADFVAAQSFRTEAFFKGLDNAISRRHFGSLFNQLWESLFIISSHIEHRRWVLMVIENDNVFYLGDQPIVMQRTHNPKDGSNLGFDVEDVEAFMPVSPKCALYMPPRSVSNEVIARYDAAMALHRTVRTIALRGLAGGAAELAIAQNTIRRSHELYQALTTGSHIRAIPAYIYNLNYLQCSWAHSGIYSNCRDFSFAQRVFQENPQYRSTPKTHLHKITLLVPNMAEK